MKKLLLIFAIIIIPILGFTLKRLKMEIDENEKAPIAVKIMSDHESGTAWNYRNYLITAAHVCENEKQLDVIINDHPETTIVLAIDKRADLCVLAPTQDMPKLLRSGKSDSKTATLYGFPGFDLKMAKSELERARSMISAYRTKEDLQAIFIHVYKLIAGKNLPGMSGGPVLDDNGDVIGLLTGEDSSAMVLVADTYYLDYIIDSLQ